MGNCFVLEEKVVKIMKMDGKVLEYRPPLKVHQVLSEFPGHLIPDDLPMSRCLRPDTKLLSGHLYYLIPMTLPSIGVNKKTLITLNPTAEDDGQRSGVVRIKLVVTKQELKEMLAKGGVLNDEMVSHLEPKLKSKDDVNDGGYGGWRPVLESIPEGSDFS